MMEARGSEPAAKNTTTFERRSDRELVVTRALNAPARIVFDAWTKPELLKRWWAPCSLGVKLFECEADVRVGGKYRYVFGRELATAVAFSGVYREVVPGARLVHTQVFEPQAAAGEAIVTATFEESHGKTKLTLYQVFPSKEALDGAVASGMEYGARETMEQLEEMLAKRGAES
jgi:uncharacterized protein YndB with AHSA1/START domain